MATLNVSTGRLTTIKLGGKLGRLYGREHHFDVSSAAEAVRAMGCMFKSFNAYLIQSKDRGVGYTVFYGKKNIKEENLRDPSGGDVIRINPVLMGSKSRWFTIIVGAVLVVVGAIFTYFGGGGIGIPMMKMGAAMIVGGVVQLLTPIPKGPSAADRPDNKPSYNFNGPVNTQAQGNPVAVLYGELIVGSAVISAGISVVDHAYIPAYGGGGFGGGTRDYSTETTHVEW